MLNLVQPLMKSHLRQPIKDMPVVSADPYLNKLLDRLL